MPPKAPAKAPAKAVAGKKVAPPTGVAALKARVAAQRAFEEKVKQEAEEEERRLEEEMRLAEIQRRIEEEEKKIAEEQKKKNEKVQKIQDKSKLQQEAIARMRAAGYVLPDDETLQAALSGKLTADAKAAPRPAPKKKTVEQQQESDNAKQARLLVEEAERNKKSETDVSSDEDVPEDVGEEVDDWEEMEAIEAEKEAALGRNEARAQRRVERAERKKKEAEEAAKKAEEENAAARHESGADIRAPICCVLGHVDTGKTSLLDRVRRTNVQGGEAGGITQQIGATYFPQDSLVTATAELNKKYKYDLKIPGLLVIDTPGHESFANLRSRGSTLCDIAVLVVDIMHGLEPQTRESIRLLRDRKCPFLIALNKVDRCLDWTPHENMDIEQTLSLQKAHTVQEFETRTREVIVQLAEEGYNAELYWRNTDVRRTISVVPTSAKTGEGICDLLLLEVSLVQRYLEGKVTFKNDLQCTILEVKPVQGIGTTIDAVLVNGVLNEGDKIVCCGLNGPIETQIRSLLTPQPLRELRIKAEYIHHKTLRAAMGVKICANDLEDVVPGTPLFVVKNEEERPNILKLVMQDMNSILKQVDRSDVGVTVQSSTLGALEALLSFLKDSNVPVASIALGPISKKHLQHTTAMRARNPRFAVVLAFDVNVTKDAQEYAKKEKIPIFEAKIIYHLFDMWEKHIEKCDAEQRDKDKDVAVFPVQIEELSQIRDRPMILQGTIKAGSLHMGTPLVAIVEDGTMKLPIGTVTSIQRDGKDIKIASTGMQCAFKINVAVTSLHFGRQFNEKNTLYSALTRESIDALKTSFLKQVSAEDWNLVRDLKNVLGIQGPKKA